MRILTFIVLTFLSQSATAEVKTPAYFCIDGNKCEFVEILKNTKTIAGDNVFSNIQVRPVTAVGKEIENDKCSYKIAKKLLVVSEDRYGRKNYSKDAEGRYIASELMSEDAKTNGFHVVYAPAKVDGTFLSTRITITYFDNHKTFWKELLDKKFRISNTVYDGKLVIPAYSSVLKGLRTSHKDCIVDKL